LIIRRITHIVAASPSAPERALTEIGSAFAAALALVARLDPDLIEIVGLSLRVTLTAVAIATLLGLPLGAAVALYRFRGRQGAIVLVNALMGIPPSVLGLILYLLFSRSGPLGVLDLLFTPTAMIVAQAVLVLPIVAALTRQVVEDLWRDYNEQLRSLGARPARAMRTLLWDGRFSLVTGVLAGFGRAAGEVGAIMIVGGNIDHLTRTMTTAIVLETSRGNFALALALGFILLALALGVNATAAFIKEAAQHEPG
jgi:tungstate transport system permease protein